MILCFSSCVDPNQEGNECNNAWIKNSTNDALILVSKRYYDPIVLHPNRENFISTFSSEYTDGYWYINTVYIYKDSVIVIKWCPSCRDMGDTKSYYNNRA